MNRFIVLWLKVDTATAANLAYIAVKLGSGYNAFENFSFQEILATGGPAAAREAYLLSSIKPGEWTPVALGPASFVGLSLGNLGPVDYEYLQDFEIAAAAGPGRRATVSFGGMEVVDGDDRYPHGVVSITFDDGLSSPYRLGLPLLATHRFPATAYVIRNLIGTGSFDNGSYMSEGQLRDLERHGWEIAAHANLIEDHNAHLGFVGLPRRRVGMDVAEEVVWLRASGFTGYHDFAFPQGWFDLDVLGAVEQYGRFQTIRTVDYRSVETLPVANPRRLRARLYDHTQEIGPDTTPGTLQWRVDQVARYGGWLILGFHDMMSATGGGGAPIINEGSAILDSDFRALLDYIARRGVPVKTVRAVWAASPGQV